MTRTGPSKPAGEKFWSGRLDNARAFLEAAKEACILAQLGDNANPILSHIVNAAIAYTDALTSKYRGRVNRKDHNAAIKALRDALGNRLPDAQERRLRKFLGAKDAAQYGARIGRLAEARRLLEELEQLATWAEDEARR